MSKPRRSLGYLFVSLSVWFFGCMRCAAGEPQAEDALQQHTAKESQQYGELLQFITIPPKSPDYVRLMREFYGAPIIPITRNPEVMADPPRIKIMAKFFGVSKQPELKRIRAAVVAIYSDKESAREKESARQIGVYGLYFADEEAAKRRFSKRERERAIAQKTSRVAPDDLLLLKGPLILYIWKDEGASDSAFEAVQQYFKAATFKRAHRDRRQP